MGKWKRALLAAVAVAVAVLGPTTAAVAAPSGGAVEPAPADAVATQAVVWETISLHGSESECNAAGFAGQRAGQWFTWRCLSDFGTWVLQVLRENPVIHNGQIRHSSGTCLDIPGADNDSGTSVRLFSCNGTGAQRWQILTDGTVAALGKCLDVGGGATHNGARVQIWTCNGTGAQRWDVPVVSGSQRWLRNPQSGRCLVANQDGAVITDCPGAALWTLG